jgi:hypothetical protein
MKLLLTSAARSFISKNEGSPVCKILRCVTRDPGERAPLIFSRTVVSLSPKYFDTYDEIPDRGLRSFPRRFIVGATSNSESHRPGSYTSV